MFVRNLFYKTLFLFISSFLILLSCANITQAQNAPKDQRGLDKTITTTTDGKNVTLTNTGKYGVPAESLTDLGLRGTRFMIYEDSSGKAYYTRTGVSSENDFKSFSQLYNSDGIGVFRIMNNGGGPYQAGNNEALELLEDGSGDPQSYAPSKKATAQNTDGSTKTTGITQDGITFLNTNISGNDANHPIVTTTEKSSNGPTYINDGTKICGPDRCTYTLMAPIGSLLGDSKGQYIINKNDQRGLCSLLNSWFRIGIALAGMLAVVMIVLGGFQYATTDSLFDKEEGKGKIQNALWGLLLALTTWLVVSTINPALANCTINAKEVKLSAMSTSIANSAFRIVPGVYSEAGSITDQANIDAKYKTITDQWTDADREALLSDDPATSKAAADKWAGIQKQLDTLNNSFASKGGSFSGGSTSRDASWGSPDAGNMNGKTVSGRQTYFSPDEAITWDSNTKKGNGAIGKLVEGTGSDGKNALKNDLGTANVVGSAGSVYYPAGTLVEINGIKYVVDDNNLEQNGSGTYVAKNQNVTNNFTVDIFTRNNNYVNTGSDTKKTMTVLYVPTTKVNTQAQLNDIRNNPGKYINR